MIINSILDSDAYKFNMQQGVLELFPKATSVYKFINRGIQRFPKGFEDKINDEIENMSTLKLTKDEYTWLKYNNSFYKPWYLEYLKNYRYDPRAVKAGRDKEDKLDIDIKGDWHLNINWEVALMAVTSELYFRDVDTNWDYDSQFTQSYEKSIKLAHNDCYYAEFGTRRRRSYKSQEDAILTHRAVGPGKPKTTLVGTSNVHFAMKHGLKAIGTQAHEWFMAMSVLESLRNANYYGLHNWVRVYNADLGIALPDTFGLLAFLKNFNLRLAKLYDGVRHDSGCPFEFTDKIVTHYKNLGIDPLSKTIIFSDGLNVDKAIKIKKYCEEKIKCSFGIGTHLTNDFPNSPALNMVIKLWSCNGVPVVKLSDTPGKVMGDSDAVRVAQWVHQGKELYDCD